jgi:hypothetical protein
MSKDLTEALHELTGIKDDPGRPQLPAPRPRGAAPHATGAALLPGGTGGNGSAPGATLTEKDVTLREYWPNGWRSSDGLFVLPAIKRLALFTDNEDTTIIHFAQPASIEDAP